MNTELRRLGKYELQQRLGSGGMAEVWKAWDTQLQRAVAIKLLHPDLHADPDFRTRFAREAQVVASLHHPNIVQIHDFQAAQPTAAGDSVTCMVMEYIEGETLADYIHRTSHRGQFPSAPEIVHLFAALGSAVDYAHQHGMVHRDIKPANILLHKRSSEPNSIGEPFLTDFGIAKLLGTTTGVMSGSWQGTPLYTAPEQVLGSPGNERSDIYSLGCILYEICTGRVPFQGDNPSVVMMKHLKEIPTAPALLNKNISPALSMVILRSLAKDPAARFPSASSLAAALAEAFNVPIPEQLNLPTYPPDVSDEPTQYRSRFLSSPLPASGGTPSSPALPPAVLSTPQVAAQSGPIAAYPASTPPGQSKPLTPSGVAFANTPWPVGSTPSAVPTGNSAQTLQVSGTIAPPASPRSPTRPSAPRKRSRGMFTILAAVLLLSIVGAGLGTFLLFPRPTAAPLSPAGYAFFINSGQLNEGNNYGIEDQFQIVLWNLPSPAAGKHYYAWLLSDSTVKPMKALLLGQLPVNAGQARLRYQHPQHMNLLTLYSRFLITEDKTPAAPSFSNTSSWRYYDAFPEIPDLKTNLGKAKGKTALIHLRNLLSDGLFIQQQYGIRGGLDIQLVRNTQKVLEWAGSARDAWNVKTIESAQFIRRQVVRILTYLDGTAPLKGIPLVQRDVRAGTPLGVPTNLASVPLVETAPEQEQLEVVQEALQSYLYRIHFQFDTLSRSPGVRPATIQNAQQLDKDLPQLKKWFLAVHADAVKLVGMTDQQLLQPQALPILSDMQVQANYAFIGKFNPATNTEQPGVIQIHYQTQQLATFVLQPYKSH